MYMNPCLSPVSHYDYHTVAGITDREIRLRNEKKNVRKKVKAKINTRCFSLKKKGKKLEHSNKNVLYLISFDKNLLK